MARGQARIRLDGLDAARKRIKGLNARATDKSIGPRTSRESRGGYNVKQCPIDTSRLLRSFRMEIRRRYMRLTWNTPYAAAVNDPHDAQGKPINTSAKGLRSGYRGEHSPGHRGLRQDGQEAQAYGQLGDSGTTGIAYRRRGLW